MSNESGVLKLALGAICILTGVVVGTSYLSAASSVATAPARIVTSATTTQALMSNYEHFFDINAGYQSRLPQIKATIAARAEATGDEKARLSIDLAGEQQMCRTLAVTYNADSNKHNREIMKSRDLPAELSIAACETGIPE